MKDRIATLTSRQCQVVRLTSLGCMSKEIAKILGIPRVAVESHRAKAKERLGVGKAALLTRIAIEYKLSSLTDTLSKAELKKLGSKAAAQSRLIM